MKALRTYHFNGHNITLDQGKFYQASRPLGSIHRDEYPVRIYEIDANGGRAEFAVHEIEDLTYDEANALIQAFNRGTATSQGSARWTI